MTAETVQTTPPAFATVAALEAHITAMGHELVPSEDEGIYLCVTCGAHTEEDAEGVSVHERLLGPCVEPLGVNYTFEEDRDEGS